MSNEMRLVSIGWPLSDALTFCHTMKKDGYDLERFIACAEEEHRKENALLTVQS